MTEGGKKRGRPRGAKNKTRKKGEAFPDPQAENGHVEPNHNQPHVAKEPLNDEQLHALTAHHAKAYEKLLAAKKASDAALKNGCKLAKAEGVPLKQIKEYIDLQTEEGQAAFREDLARQHMVARWAGMPVGTQMNFFDEVDRTPSDEQAKSDGKRAGLRGEKCEAPRHLPGNLVSAWTEGWHSGQEVLAGKIKQQRQEDGEEFDKNPPAPTAPQDDLDDDREAAE